VASLVGLIALFIAAPAGADPARKPPVTFSGIWETESALQAQGFVTPKVLYRLGASQDIVVVYDGGGPADPLEATGQIELTVWGHERFRFGRLIIQDGRRAPVTVNYADLEATFGARPAGFGEQPLSVVEAAAGVSASETLFSHFLDPLKLVLAAMIGIITLMTLIALGMAILGSRKRQPDEPSRRLFT
jgi:hypothetical protein